ncbi:MAG: hypothetical protein IT442_01730, partial [Phycisphaeraceae bacterium]|nr:hypothetical protein [Phycisphaeraceae bacterium]
MTSTTGGRQSIQPSRVFNLAPLGAMLPSPLAAVVQPSLEGLLHFGALNRMYERLGRKASPRDFCQAVLDDLDVSVRVRATDMAKIPRTGPLLVLSNHPFGGLDGLMLAAILLSVRPDAKVMANFILAQIPDLRRLFIFVNPFGNPAAVRQNIRGL